jgi:hypothetical protein
MPAALALVPAHRDQVDDYLAALKQLSKGCGRSTVMAARSFAGKLQRAGGWDRLTIDQQIDAIVKARAFASWLIVTGRLTVGATSWAGSICGWVTPPATTVPTRTGGSPTPARCWRCEPAMWPCSGTPWPRSPR